MGGIGTGASWDSRLGFLQAGDLEPLGTGRAEEQVPGQAVADVGGGLQLPLGRPVPAECRPESVGMSGREDCAGAEGGMFGMRDPCQGEGRTFAAVFGAILRLRMLLPQVIGAGVMYAVLPPPPLIINKHGCGMSSVCVSK